jgi:hypothetical protein
MLLLLLLLRVSLMLLLQLQARRGRVPQQPKLLPQLDTHTRALLPVRSAALSAPKFSLVIPFLLLK